MMGRIVSTFCCPRTMPLLRFGGLWRILFACGRAYVVLEWAEMNMARMREVDGIGMFAGHVCFARPGEADTMGLAESTWRSLNSKT